MPRNKAAHATRMIGGYLKKYDAVVISELLEYQSQVNIAGGVVEIGVHHGRLFLLMALHLAGLERGLAIDLFDRQSENLDRSGKGNRNIFERHAARLNVSDRISIIEMSSFEIKAGQIRELLKGEARAFSVDGGHFFEVVVNDMLLATESLTKGGVVIVDDFFNYGWPDVSWAVANFCQKNGDLLIPFAVTPSKLLLTNDKESAERYRTFLSKLRWPSPEKKQEMNRESVIVFDNRDLTSTLLIVFQILKNRIKWKFYK
jgi:hypothetical protein